MLPVVTMTCKTASQVRTCNCWKAEMHNGIAVKLLPNTVRLKKHQFEMTIIPSFILANDALRKKDFSGQKQDIKP